MGNWRRDHRENFQQEWHPITSSESKYKKPPSGWSRQPIVPSWENRFCTSVCKIPCNKICESKIFQSYQKVLEWNDSASQEALQNAVTRLRAEINGLHCYVPLPDPELYIDVIDWSSSIDPKLLSALDGERRVSERDEDEI